MGKLTLILGGARSGKSRKAEELAAAVAGDNVLFVATGQALDQEMRIRIEKHRAARPTGWHTLELPRNIAPGIQQHSGGFAALVLDCVTLLISNLLVDEPEPYAEQVQRNVEQEIDAIVQAARLLEGDLIVVSNEVGTGLAPLTQLGRAYRDLLGQANQHLAAAADEVILMVAGLPLVLKPQGKEDVQ